jgi:hypothetical protein
VGAVIAVVVHLELVLVLVEAEIAPAEAEDKKDGLRDGVEDAEPALALAGLGKLAEELGPEANDLELGLKELAEEVDDAPDLRAVDPDGARDKRADVRGRGLADDLGLVALKQGLADEEPEEILGEGRAARGVPEEEELRVARLERPKDQGVEDGEERRELVLALLDELLGCGRCRLRRRRARRSRRWKSTERC